MKKKLRLPNTFSQNDPRWKDSPLGTKGTIGNYGCLMIDGTMVVNYYGFRETPLTMNQKLTENGGYDKGNLFVWSAIPRLFPGLKYRGKWSNKNPLTQAQMNQIRGAIDKGYPVILQIDTIPITAALDEHWVLAIGYDGDDFIIQDPWDGAEKRITSWGVIPQKLIYSWCWYEGKPAEVDSAEGCLVPNTKEERKKYEEIVVASEKWVKALKILEIEGDPSTTPTDKVKSVIAGYKSRETDLKNQLTDSQKDLAVANQEITNRTEQVSRLEGDLREKDKYYKDLIQALKSDIKNLPKILEQAQGRIGVLEGEVDEANKEKGKALNKAAEYKSLLETCEKGQSGQPKPSKIKELLNALIKIILETVKRREVKKDGEL